MICMKKRSGGREKGMIFYWRSRPKAAGIFRKDETKTSEFKSDSRAGHKTAQKCDP